jgi:hypothetical protein
MPPRSSLNTELTLGVNAPLKETKETKVKGYGLKVITHDLIAKSEHSES